MVAVREARTAVRMRRETAQPRGEDTRLGLLAAAEQILLEEGIQALTVRHIGTCSGLNPTLITYHFGTIAGLLAELCRLNLQTMLVEWQALRDGIGRFETAREILELWLAPLLRPATFNKAGRTLIVLDEIASHGDPELREQLLGPMVDIGQAVQDAIRPFVPHLDARELRARVRFLSAATLGPPPRARVVIGETGEEPIDGLNYLVRFAEAALGLEASAAH